MHFYEIIALLFCLGVFAGSLVGLVGIGATLVILPTLLLWFPHFMASSLAIKMAVATTLACASFSVIFAAYLHIKNGNVKVKLCAAITSIYILTAIIGPYLVHILSTKIITIVVSVILILIAIKIVLKSHKKNKALTTANPFTFILVMLIAGFTNSICGVGSGNVAIPFLSRHYPAKQAVAASVVSAIFACALGAISYVIYGWGLTNLPKHSFGYVYLVAFFPLVVGIVLGTPLGYKLSEKLQADWLKFLLAILVAFAGIFAFCNGIRFA